MDSESDWIAAGKCSAVRSCAPCGSCTEIAGFRGGFFAVDLSAEFFASVPSCAWEYVSVPTILLQKTTRWSSGDHGAGLW